MSSLMALPRELRDQIYTYVILSQKNEPPSLALRFEEILHGRVTLDTPRLKAWGDRVTVQYRPDDTVAACTNLLLVNRQIHAETMDNLRLLPEARTYDLDITVCDEVVLAPTWVRVPMLAASVDTVNATFRIAGSYQCPPKSSRSDRRASGPYARFGHYKGFRGGCGAGPAMDWQIYSILERFFKVGPKGKSTHADEDRHVSLKVLDINVETPPGIEAARFGPPKSSSSMRKIEKPDDHVLDPGYLVRFIAGDLDYLLRMDYHTAEYGRILYEYLDEVVVRLDGEEIRHYDMAQRLRDVQYTDSFMRNQAKFDQWKEQAAELRQERGLRTV